MVAPSMVVPAAVLAGFAIGFPVGAYVGSILTLILPITVALGFGSQVSLVNITMQALSAGFRIPVAQVSKGNAPYVGACLALLILLAFTMV